MTFRWQGFAVPMIHAVESVSRCTYQADFTEATRHLVSVSLWVPQAQQTTLKLIFPVWTPGSYMVREYTRNIECLEVTAHTEIEEVASAARVACRVRKNVWEAEFEDHPWLCVSYQLYCREMSVRTNWFEQEFGFLTGAASFPFVEGRQS